MRESDPVSKIRSSLPVHGYGQEGRLPSLKGRERFHVTGDTREPLPAKLSDIELETLIKRLGLPIDKKIASTARFLIKNHFSLSSDVLSLAVRLLPSDAMALEGSVGKALLLAIARLPLAQVAELYPMMARVLKCPAQNMWSWVSDLSQALRELESLCLRQDMKGQDWLTEGLAQEAFRWEQCLRSPQLQLSLLMERWQLFQSQQNLRHSALLMRRLQKTQILIGDQKWNRPLSKIIESATHVEECLQVDGILSIEDDDQHFKEKGACMGLSLWSERDLLPARLWHESSGEHEIDPCSPWVFRLQWQIEGQGELDVVLTVIEGVVRLRWESESHECLSCMKGIASELRDHLAQLDFKLAGVTYVLNDPFEPLGTGAQVAHKGFDFIHIDTNA